MTDFGRPHVLVAGVTTRALAVSAARAGYRVTAVDAFGDSDLRQVAEVISLRSDHPTGFGPLAAAAAARAVPADLVAYTSNYENHPEAVALLAHGRRLLGNPPETLVRVRDPIGLMRVLRNRGFATPKTRATAAVFRRDLGSWLLKPRRSGGGHGTTVWRGRAVPRTSYLQERIAGTPGSIVFAADGRRAVPLGISRQLVADGRLGAHGFRYCGSLLGNPRAGLFPKEEQVLETATELAAAVTEEFALVGLNGLDFIARNGVPYPIEVNPRYSASMELLERAGDVSIFGIHARACGGVLPSTIGSVRGVEGKAILFARRDLTLGDTRRWLENDALADIPHSGEHIRRGHPICTVFAQGRDAITCHRLLVRRAAVVYRQAEQTRKGAA